MKTVLVVEDADHWVRTHLRVLEGRVIVITAMTREDALRLYQKHRDELDAIILDGCVPGDAVNTHEFIRAVSADIRAGYFSGPLMAASSLAEYRKEMMATGCTHETWKDEAAKYTLTLLGVY